MLGKFNKYSAVNSKCHVLIFQRGTGRVFHLTQDFAMMMMISQEEIHHREAQCLQQEKTSMHRITRTCE